MSEIVFLVEEAAEGVFLARGLGESIHTQAETLEALREQVRDAVRCHFDEGGGPAVASRPAVGAHLLNGPEPIY